ncbi:hypothetical protein ACYCS5_02095 [Paenibacillus sp. SEL3]|jgi:hypothetical protein|uniref:Uncharacterized protein n=3 Tax=Paenibacillus TaxID=44249 RepID=A0A1C3CAW1_PAEPO|nr:MULTISPECIES: hypothetical protein [Paenibacillus]MCF2719831.1 hypothetical protein [Paenibacillus sp. UKAQ_18]AIW40720.1 hypothetical protein X809_32405 [Paenibacillus polymyxa CR1]ALA43005.1 hypothetical protein ABE82_16425 [Paenibacillus peoriae]AOK88977.1 hypothetical protein AOU00_03645 [Paenibacillus polymyxa]APB75201.1 hypothetical protein PPYC2_09565 [Paenibacillus polymyxa]
MRDNNSEKNRTDDQIEHKQSLDKREPGFNRIPDTDADTPAATDMIDEAIGRGIDKLRNDFTK